MINNNMVSFMGILNKWANYTKKTKWLVLGLVIASLLSCQQSEWKKFSSSEGRFSVLIPGVPTEKIIKVNTKAGIVDLHILQLEGTEFNYLAVSYGDYPKETVTKENINKILDGARDGAVSNVHGKLISELIITLDNYPGREIKVEIPNGKHILISRIYLVRNRLYSISLITHKNNIFTTELYDKAHKFFDSFQLMSS